jgi:hypothetical protein
MCIYECWFLNFLVCHAIICSGQQAQAGIEDDEDVGETSPLNVRSADGGKFMEEFFDQV